MKLLAKTNKYYFIFLVLFSPVMIAVDYFVIQFVVNREVKEILLHESNRITYSLEKEAAFPSSNYIYDTTIIKTDIPVVNQFRDTSFYEAYAEKLIPYRIYAFSANLGDQKYNIVLRYVLLETHQLITWLFVTTALVLLTLAFGLFLVNQRISKWAWGPFFRNLTVLKQYDITQKSLVSLESSNIDEFDTLNKVVTNLMKQIEEDFQNLKEFNENISHEIQTPLAIIRNKMVLLMESQDLNEKELKWIQTAYNEINKLSKIGKSLTLISRIENHEFKRMESVDIRVIVDEVITNMEEIINFKEFQLTVELNPVQLNCDPILANILFTNFIKNAIQHNYEGGYIRILLQEDKFELENTGEVLMVDPVHLFDRFKRGNSSPDSIGLGLAINKKICEFYGFSLNYEHHEGKHTFSLFFNQAKELS